MNILYIAGGVNLGNSAHRYGFSVTNGILKALAINNKITLISPADFGEARNDDLQIFKKMCGETFFIKQKRRNRLSRRAARIKNFINGTLPEEYRAENAEMSTKIKSLDKPGRFDIAFYDGYNVTQYAKYITCLPRLFHLCDSVTLGAREFLKSPTLSMLDRMEILRQMDKIEQFERINYTPFDKIVVVAERDRSTLVELNPGLNVEVLPLSVDTDYFKNNFSESYNAIIFVGTLWTPSNTDAARYFYNDILPLIKRSNPDVTLILVGCIRPGDIKNLGIKGPDVKITGFVEDIRPYLGSASVFISPMRIGSGMNNKLLEAMSMAKAIVTTEFGNRGAGLKNGAEAIVCRDRHEFAGGVLSLLADKQKRGSFGSNARKKAEENFSISAYAQRLQAIMGKVLNK